MNDSNSNNDQDGEARQTTTPYVEDQTMLHMHVITPKSEETFRSINREIVLSNLNELDLEFLRATQNLIETIQNLELTPSIRKDIRVRYQLRNKEGELIIGYTPIDRVVDSFISEMSILANASRGLNMAQAQLLQTSITKATIKKTQERKGVGGFFKGNKQDEFNESMNQ